MGVTITITMNDDLFPAQLNDSPTAKGIAQALPMIINLSRWGGEFYGDCGLEFGADETAREEMEVGELAYWPPGTAFCIFFGPTPASSGEKPVAASAAIPIGKITGNVEKLQELGNSIRAIIDRA